MQRFFSYFTGRRLITHGMLALAMLLGMQAHAQNNTMKVLPFETLQFSPKEAGSPQISPVMGDPEKAASSIVMKMGKGDFPLHTHTANYQLVVVKGTMKHWGPDGSKEKAKPIGPGGHWYQPAGEVHGDACLSDECVWFIHFDGARDFAFAKDSPARAHKLETTRVQPFESLQFSKKEPGNPQIAPVRGNPEKEASSIIMKMGCGAFPLHTHTSDYQLVVIKGNMKHWGANQTQAQAVNMAPGSYWYQPASEVHADSCESDECVWYITFKGPRDFAAAEVAKK
jgi:quercetin dioxygenase-like cupin family protein